MPVRFPSIGPARALYLVVVSVALCTVSYRTFAAVNNTPSADPTGSLPAPVSVDSVPGPSVTVVGVPTTADAPLTTTGKNPSSRPSGLQGVTETTATLTAPPSHGNTSTTVPPTTVHLSPTTTSTPATTTTIYRPGSLVYTIPKGTRARMDRGEDVSDILPLTVDMKVNQYIYLVNKDDYFYSYGPLDVMPQSTTAWFFSTPGNTVGYCDIARTTVTFRVTA